MTKPFRITRPGKYRTRDGKCVTITDIVDALTFCAFGSISGRREIWTACGKLRPGGTSAEDIVAPWTAKPKPRKRRTRDVRMWAAILTDKETGKPTSADFYNRKVDAMISRNAPQSIIASVTIHGVPVRK